MPRKKRDGSPMFAPQRPALVIDRVRYVGDPVAIVIAETLAQAKDAAELVVVDYGSLPSVTSVAEAAEPSAPRVWDENPDNISHTYERGDRQATEAAFARAARIVKRRYVITRVHAQYMEPRGAIGTYDLAEDRYTLFADVNYPHRVRNMLANMVFKVPESKVRVVCHDVGGGFGAKGWQYVEHRLTLWAARKLGRPVKWRCERSEVLMADEHGRDNVGTIELAFDDSRKIIGLRLHMLASIGAYVGSDRQFLTPFGMIGTVVGVYDIPAAYVSIDAVLSNTSPTAPYRGAGRPEAIYLIERAMEAAAQELHIDPIELRRRNIIPDAKIPFKSPLGPYYDCGRFNRNMEIALEAADYAGFAVRRDASRARGMLRGIGLANAIEQAAGPTPEYAEIRFNPSGSAILLMGTKTHGQGHETAFKQIMCGQLGIDPSDVQFIDGDTDRVAFGMGSNGSRSMVTGGTALTLAAQKVIDKGKRIAAHLLEAADADIEFADGRFGVAGTDRGLTLKQVVTSAFQPGAAAAGRRTGHVRTCDLRAETRHLSERLPCLRTGNRSGDRRGRPAVVSGRRRRRHRDQSADLGRPDPRRRGAGRRPDPDGAGGVRAGIGPVADSEFHGLLHAARRGHVRHQDRQQPGADGGQSAGRQGCGRGRHGRRAPRGDDRRDERTGAARCARIRHAGDQRSDLARDPRRAGRRLNRSCHGGTST